MEIVIQVQHMLESCSWDHGPEGLPFNTLCEKLIRHSFDVIGLGDNEMWRRIQWGLFLMLWNCCRYSLKTLLWLVGKSCSLSVKSLEWKILIFVPTINVLERKLLAPLSYWDPHYLYKGKMVQFSWVCMDRTYD